ncbi:MAG: TVP38/TMEM64 family protein [Thermostichales cyanobacterium SZTDM-1c_bins_54]
MDALGEQLRQGLVAGIDGIAQLGWVGGVLFVLLYALGTVALLPVSWLSLAAGAVYGVGWGSCYVLIGATLGAHMAFLIGRHLARERVNRWLAGIPAWQGLVQGIDQGGWKLVGVIRLSPLLPFNLLNYALGLTSLSPWEHLLGMVGILPGTVMYVYWGSLAGDVATAGLELSQWGVRLLGLVATVAVSVYLAGVAKKSLTGG